MLEGENKRELHQIGAMFYELLTRFEGVCNKKHLYKGIDELTVIEIKTIVVIGSGEAMSMSQIAKKLGVTSGTPTVTIDRLIEKGFVERIRDVEDRRQVFVTLSDKGDEVYHDINDLKHKVAENIFGLLSREERALFLSILLKLNSNFNLVFDALSN
jgi:DNA-binding MarR family transcriptional regulator